MSIENLARAERQHAEAVAEHQAALEKERGISDRLKDAAALQSAITQRRLNGESNDQEAAEFAALNGDVALLQKMLTTAQAGTKLAADKLHACYVAHSEFEASHARMQDQAKYEALLAKTREIETLFVKAIRATGLAGKRVGHFTLTQSFTKSDALHRALDLGVIPPEL